MFTPNPGGYQEIETLQNALEGVRKDLVSPVCCFSRSFHQGFEGQFLMKLY
jgi:hypothetical protein